MKININELVMLLDGVAGPNFDVVYGINTVMAIVLVMSVLSGLLIYKIVKDARSSEDTEDKKEDSNQDKE